MNKKNITFGDIEIKNLQFQIIKKKNLTGFLLVKRLLNTLLVTKMMGGYAKSFDEAKYMSFFDKKWRNDELMKLVKRIQ